jgi:DNA-binding CsgD family transcriptional regulator
MLLVSVSSSIHTHPKIAVAQHVKRDVATLSLIDKQLQIEWRRAKLLELSSQGHSQPEISRILQISQPTVNRDVGYLRVQIRQNLQKIIQDKLPEDIKTI